MKVLFWSMNVCHCNFATSKSIKTHIDMKKIFTLILVIMTFALHAIAQMKTPLLKELYWNILNTPKHQEGIALLCAWII